MNSGSVTAQARSFRDLREICKRADIMMLDHQRRDDDTGFQQNGDTGKRVHGCSGWDKLAPESMAMYQSGPGYFRVASKPAPEARMWMIVGHCRRDSAVVASCRARITRTGGCTTRRGP